MTGNDAGHDDVDDVAAETVGMRPGLRKKQRVSCWCVKARKPLSSPGGTVRGASTAYS
ncbi:hypothetical protein K443DRAFT_467838 [Laccaria amethystina LaAM-08-1]|jgi:hypothetical protein|uniref:Uncharacterized protein n=1 Tax=Laccaria amethystina LaAM-08-1 TaxID=1095629 RepID=A0A0C9WNC7_9AGAR|nr:hypothetical protein K443DRAFT_467838 [Laccaria amethystina LaAM-08-1]